MNRTFLAAALLSAAVTAAHATPAADLAACRTTVGDAAIAACSAYLANPAGLTPAQTALGHMLRAQGYIAQRQLKEALADYEAATRATPADADAWYSHAVVAAGLSRPDLAIADLTRVIALRPDWAQAYVARGAMHLARGEAQQALDDDTRALQLDPNNADAKADRDRAQQLLRAKP